MAGAWSTCSSTTKGASRFFVGARSSVALPLSHQWATPIVSSWFRWAIAGVRSGTLSLKKPEPWSIHPRSGHITTRQREWGRICMSPWSSEASLIGWSLSKTSKSSSFRWSNEAPVFLSCAITSIKTKDDEEWNVGVSWAVTVQLVKPKSSPNRTTKLISVNLQLLIIELGQRRQ